jgi:hypothetical protein
MSDIESDNSSITSSTTSFGDISVCEEIGQLIERCEDLNNHIHNSFQTLETIHSIIKNNNNIMVTHNDLTVDFDDLLESLHSETIHNIKNDNTNNFGQKLLDIVNNSYFH